jgi:hypothetical protein
MLMLLATGGTAATALLQLLACHCLPLIATAPLAAHHSTQPLVMLMLLATGGTAAAALLQLLARHCLPLIVTAPLAAHHTSQPLVMLMHQTTAHRCAHMFPAARLSQQPQPAV